MSDIKEKILSLGRDGKVEELLRLVENQGAEQLAETVRQALAGADGTAVLLYTLQALQSRKETERTCLVVMKTTLTEVVNSTRLPSSTVKTIIDELENSTRTLNSEGLADLAEFLIRCVEDIDETADERDVSWIHVFASLLMEVKDKEFITSKDTGLEVSGAEYRKNLISSVCELRWGPRTSISMCLMFQDAKLSNLEVEEVFNKMNSSLARTSLNNLAPFFHQLLKLLRNHPSCSGKLSTTITEYFTSKLSIAERESSSRVTMDSVELIHTDCMAEEIQETEGIIIYHITQAAKMGHPIAGQIAKITRASTNFPAGAMNPFNLFTCLALTSVNQLKDSILESLKITISKGFSMEGSREASVWFRTHTPAIPDISALLSLVISQSVRFGGWDLIGQGLVDLGFIMLDVQPALGKMNEKTRAIHHLGAALLARVIRKHSSSAQIILTKLTGRIIVNAKAAQYTTALRVIVKDATTYLMEDGNSSAVTNLIENIYRLSYPAGRATLNALVPLLKLHRSLRNPLILVLRKALFARNVQTRQVAVHGVFNLLKTFKISTNMASSQLSQSSGSLTQLSIDIQRGGTASNDSLCIELLGVLKRCFTLQPKVKVIFYSGIDSVVSKNPELCEGFLELLHQHVLQVFGSTAEENLILFDLNKALVERSGTWWVAEPVGWFLHALQTLVCRAQQLLDAGDSTVLDRLTALIERLVEQYSEVEEVGDLGFDPTENYDRKTSEGKKRCLKVEVLLTILEGLMEYLMNHGADKQASKAGQLLKLHHNHLSLRNLLSSTKPRKGGKKGEKGEKAKKDEGNESRTEGGEKEKQERGFKRPADMKDPDEFTMEPTAFSLRSVSVLLHSVLENRVPENQAALSTLRRNTEFLEFLHSVLAVLLDRSVSALSLRGDEGVETDNTFRFLQNITASLFRHTILSSEPVEEFLVAGSELLVSYLEAILHHFPRRNLRLVNSLSDANPGNATDNDLNPALVPVLRLVIKKMSRLSDALGAEENAAKKLVPVVGVYSLLLMELNGERPAEGPYDWLKKFTEQFSSEDSAVCKSIVKLTFLANLRVQSSGSLCPRTARQLHCIYGDLDTSREVEVTKNIGFLTDDTSEIVLTVLIGHLDASVEYCDQAITWLKSLAGSTSAQVDVPATEKALSEQLAKMVNPTLELVNTALPVGTISDLTLKFLIKLYRILGNLANYFFLRTRSVRSSVKSSKFDMLVHVVATQLSPNVYSLITFIQKKYKEQEDEAKAARVRKNKVLDPNIARAKVIRETKEIPNLIFQIETFEKNMAKVGKRINQKFEFKLPTSRDFRIRLTEEHMKELNGEESDAESDQSLESEAEEGEAHSSADPRSQNSVLSVSNRSQSSVLSEAAATGEPAPKRGKLAAKLSKLKENRTQK